MDGKTPTLPQKKRPTNNIWANRHKQILNRVRTRVRAKLAKRPAAERLGHTAMPMPHGNKNVRKRVYFRWCKRRELDPMLDATLQRFAKGTR